MTIEYFKGCFNTSVDVDGKDFKNLPKQQQMSIITKLLITDQARFEVILHLLENFTLNKIDHDFTECGQCGDFNETFKVEL